MMLLSHMNQIEKTLIVTSKIPDNAGHSLHKGTPREIFIAKFLENHLPANVRIGSGELIDSASRPGEARNQFDIVVYKYNYPKLDFGGDISGFLIESVNATIEVKSILTKQGLKNAIRAAKRAKALIPRTISSFHSGYVPPRVQNFVIAYTGPAKMKTVYEWIPDIHKDLGIETPPLPVEAKERIAIASPSIDAVFVLGKGFVYFDNQPTGFATQKMRSQTPNLKWIIGNSSSGSLLLFFVMLQQSTANIEGKWLNASSYLAKYKVESIDVGQA